MKTFLKNSAVPALVAALGLSLMTAPAFADDDLNVGMGSNNYCCSNGNVPKLKLNWEPAAGMKVGGKTMGNMTAISAADGNGDISKSQTGSSTNGGIYTVLQSNMKADAQPGCTECGDNSTMAAIVVELNSMANSANQSWSENGPATSVSVGDVKTNFKGKLWTSIAKPGPVQ